MELNRYQITRDTHRVDLNVDIGSNVYAGTGLILNDPLAPIPAPLSPFARKPGIFSPVKPRETNKPINQATIESATTEFVESSALEALSRSLYVNFKAKYGFASASASMRHLKETKETKSTLLAIIGSRTTSDSISDDQLIWKAAPLSEDERVKDDERLRQFISLYGSHFIQSITYGFRIAIVGEVTSSSEEERLSFALAFKAKFGGGGAGANVNMQQNQILEQKNVSLTANIVAGEISPRQSVQINEFAEIRSFLEKVRSREIKLWPGPMAVLAKSYFPFLLDFPKSRMLLSPFAGERAKSPFGVPRGTVISWFPSENDYGINELGEPKLLVPEGWALADGQVAPDMVGRFPMGAREGEEAGVAGGAIDHQHSGVADGHGWDMSGEYSHGQGSHASRANHSHTISVSKTEHLPPFVKLIFLIKL